VYEGIVLHDQGKTPGYRRTAMAMKYQKGTVYLRGQKVKMWYGKYTVYLRNEEGKEVGKRRNVPLCPKARTPKWKAEQMLHALILNETGVPAKTTSAIPDGSATFRWFVEERYIPMREGAWSPAYRKINTYEIKHYLVDRFGRIPLGQLGTFEIQVWLNKLAGEYSQSVVRHCYANIRSIVHMAKKLGFLTSDLAEDVTMPQTKPVAKPRMTQKQILAHSRPARSVSDVCRHFLRSESERGTGLAVEVLDGNHTGSAWHGIRGAVLFRQI
jgi:hypothetical protein